MKNFFLSSRIISCLILLFLLANLSCSQDSKSSKNSAEYQYSEAKRAVSDSKFEKAIGLTGEIISKFPQSEFADRARILRIILLSGLSEAHANMAEAYMSGFEKSIKNAGALRSNAFDYYRKQKNEALGFYEACDFFLKNFSDQTPYVLDCELPSKDFTPNRTLDEVRSGTLPGSEHRKTAEAVELSNGVISSVTGFLGAGGDRARARKLLEGGPKPLDHAEFMVMLGRTLLNDQKLFGRTALNEIQNYRQFYQKSSECTELALKILKDKPNKEIQSLAEQLKTELEALEKKPAKTS
jgi:hypothetical protein